MRKPGLALVEVVLGICSTLPAVEVEATQMAALAERADRARETRRQLRDAWSAEAAQLAVVVQALQHEAERLEQSRQNLQSERRAIGETLAAAEAGSQRRLQLDQRVTELTQQLDEALQQLTATSALRIHQTGTEDQATPPGNEMENLVAAFGALAVAESQARQIARRRLSGRLPDGSLRAVEVLAIGGAAAWWLASDGAVGTVTSSADGLLLQPVAEPSAADRIRALFAMQAGTRPAALTAVPLPAGEQRP